MNACPIIDRLTRPILLSGVPNRKDSKLCAADGWIVEGWEHVNRYTFEALWLSPQQFSRGVRLLSDFLQFSDLTVRSPAVLSVEVRRGPNFFHVLISHRPTFWSKQYRLHFYEGGTTAVRN